MLRNFYELDNSFILNNYEINEIISTGHNYSVFLVIEKKSKKNFALRILKTDKTDEKMVYTILYNIKFNNISGILRIFHFERFLSMRPIPKILTESFENDDDFKNPRYFLIIEEYMHGKDIDYLLQQYLRTKGTKNKFMNPTIRNKIIFGIAATMKSLHKLNLIHGNLNTSHIFLDDNLEPRISYCRLPKTTYDFESNYIPVQMISGENNSIQSDVYCYSILLYKIFSKSIKYESSFNGELLLKRPNNISDAFWQLIQLCMNKNLDERPTFAQITEWLKDDKYAIEEYGMKANLDELHEYQKRIDI